MTTSSSSPFGDAALTAPRAAVDHELAARVARGWNLVHRPLRWPRDLAALEAEADEWRSATATILRRRFADESVLRDWTESIELRDEPLTRESLPRRAARLHDALHLDIAWLEDLRRTLAMREAPARALDDTRLDRHLVPPVPAVLSPTTSGRDAAVVEIVRRLTGNPAVPVLGQDRVRGLIEAAEDRLPPGAVAVVVVDRAEHDWRVGEIAHADQECTFALGYAAGALGPRNVIAACLPGVHLEGALQRFRIVHVSDGATAWPLALAKALSDGGCVLTPAGAQASAAATEDVADAAASEGRELSASPRRLRRILVARREPPAPAD